MLPSGICWLAPHATRNYLSNPLLRARCAWQTHCFCVARWLRKLLQHCMETAHCLLEVFEHRMQRCGVGATVASASYQTAVVIIGEAPGGVRVLCALCSCPGGSPGLGRTTSLCCWLNAGVAFPVGRQSLGGAPSLPSWPWLAPFRSPATVPLCSSSPAVRAGVGRLSYPLSFFPVPANRLRPY